MVYMGLIWGLCRGYVGFIQGLSNPPIMENLLEKKMAFSKHGGGLPSKQLQQI